MVQDLALLQTPGYQRKLAQCIHCGLCLPACPTYAVFGTEMESPRGRVALIRAVSQGRIEPNAFQESFSPHINLCLACRACETACPSGVQYGSLVETARVVVEHNRTPGLGERFLRWLGADQLMTHPGQLKLAARLAWLYQKSGLQRLVRKLDVLPPALKAMEALLPPVSPHYSDYRTPAAAEGEKRGALLFFTGCIQEGFLSPVNQATLRVLQRNGYEVTAPAGQTCCGAAHLHLGDVEAARRLARQNIDAFLERDGEAVICNAGGCGLALKEYPHLLAEDPQYADKALRFAARVRDANEFVLDHLRQPPQGEVRLRATYSDSCHLRHGQKVARQPRQLLSMVPGLVTVELSQPDRCCGSAGVYNIAQAGTADAILDEKMADIAATGASLVVTSNPGCQMQLIAGVRRAGLQAQVLHVMEVLDLSYRSEAPDGHPNR